MGAFSDAVVDFLQARNIIPTSAAISIADKDIIHGLRTAKNNPMPISTWVQLPSLLAKPEAVYWDLRNPGLVYVVDNGQGKFVVLVDYTTKVNRKQVTVNTVRTGSSMDSLREFENQGRYKQIL